MKRKGIVAVVTGAASGIGEALAVQLHAEGARLVLVDVAADALRAVAARLPGARVEVVDVSDRAAVFALAARVEAELGGAALLINNAGVTVVSSFTEHSEEDWQRVMGVNFFGVLHGCQAFLPQLRRQPQGWIVNLSSIFGVVGVPGQTAYCASKFAVRGFSEALNEELRGGTVGLTVVHPGGVRTNIVNQAKVSGSVAGADFTARFNRAGIPAPAAAAQILDAVEQEQGRLRVGPDAVVLDWLRRLMPEWGNQIAVNAISKAMGLSRGAIAAATR